MKKNILKKVSIGMTLGLTLLPFLALAQLVVPGAPVTGPTSLDQITSLIQKILNWVAGIVIFIAIIMLLYAAILFLTAGGSEDRVKKAKNYLIYAIVGIAVAVLAWTVTPLIINILR